MKRLGFSLLELLVALAIMAMLAGTVVWNGRRGIERAGPRALAERVAAECRALRSAAMASGTPYALVLPTELEPAHCEAFYVLAGATRPRIVRSVRLGDEYPNARLFSGYWPLTGGLVNQAPTEVMANQGDFDLTAWDPPHAEHAIYVFLPTGAVVSNRVRFGGAYHVLVCSNLSYSAGAVEGEPAALLTGVEAAHTVKLSQAGLVSLEASLSGSGALGTPATLAPPGALAPPLPGPSNGNPVLDPLEVSPQPVAGTLPPGIDATVSLGGRLSLVARATDPDGDDLTARWNTDGGSFSGEASPLEFDGNRWVGRVEWTPPPAAVPGQIFTLGVTVDDGRGGSDSGSLGVAGRVLVLEPGRIIFMSTRDGPLYQLYAMNGDGTDQRRLTFSAFNDQVPRFSPDGVTIAFTRNSDLWLMNADGTNQRMLLDKASIGSGSLSGLCWSPDGTRIGFTAWFGSLVSLGVVRVDGTSPTVFSGSYSTAGCNSLDWYYSRPFSSADPQSLVYFDAAAGNLVEQPLDGSPANLVALGTSGGFGQEVALSPRGDLLYYTDAGATAHICPYSPGTVGAPVASSSGVYTLRWSPGGDRIVYDRFNLALATTELFVSAPDFTGEVSLTGAYPNDDEADWGP